MCKRLFKKAQKKWRRRFACAVSYQYQRIFNGLKYAVQPQNRLHFTGMHSLISPVIKQLFMQQFNRRQFIATASAFAAVPSLENNIEKGTTSKLVHHVFFWLKKPGSQADREALMKGLKTLTAIKEVKQLLIGTPAATEQRGVVDGTYDVSELMYFDNLEDQAAYQVHAVHKAFVEQYSHLWEKVVVYDMLVE